MHNITESFRLNRLANEAQNRTSCILLAARKEEREMTASECMTIAHEAVKAFRIRHPENSQHYRELLGKEITKAFKSRKLYKNHTAKVVKFYSTTSLASGG